jgi:DNA-binding transcriptional MerR regulator
MRATELMTSIPGITLDHLHNWERQGYLAPSRIKVGKKRIRDYSEKDAHLIKAMWFYYRKGLSPKNAYRNATEEVSNSSFSALPDGNGHREDQERQERQIDALEGIAIFELAIPLRHYFHLKMAGKEHGWVTNS